jgi:hypothetical protein
MRGSPRTGPPRRTGGRLAGTRAQVAAPPATIHSPSERKSARWWRRHLPASVVPDNSLRVYDSAALARRARAQLGLRNIVNNTLIAVPGYFCRPQLQINVYPLKLATQNQTFAGFPRRQGGTA